MLKEQRRATKSIDLFTKITLKNQVDDLLDRFREYHHGKAKLTMADLRRSYDLLMMKVLSLLQDADQKLASAIVSSREAIWGHRSGSERTLLSLRRHVPQGGRICSADGLTRLARVNDA